MQLLNLAVEPTGISTNLRGRSVLVCTAGEGWYQREGKKAKSLKPGDTIIPAGIKHWHGAEKNTWFSHLSIEVLAKTAAMSGLSQFQTRYTTNYKSKWIWKRNEEGKYKNSTIASVY